MKTTLNELRSLVKQVLKENDEQQNIVELILSGEVELGLMLLKSLRPRIVPTKFLMEHFGELLKLLGLPLSKDGLIDLGKSDKEFYLIDLNLKSLPESIGYLKHLKGLYGFRNNLSSLPQSIGKLKNLYAIDFGNNLLTSIPETICTLPILQYLHLGHNNLTSLPNNIGNLTQLMALELNDNKLTSLPKSIINLQQLEELRLWGNSIPKETIERLKEQLPNCKIIDKQT